MKTTTLADSLRRLEDDLANIFTPLKGEIDLLKRQNEAILAALNMRDPQPYHSGNDTLTNVLDQLRDVQGAHDRIVLERTEETTSRVMVAVIVPLQESVQRIEQRIGDIEQRISHIEESLGLGERV